MVFLGRCLNTSIVIRSMPGDFLGVFFFRLKALGGGYIGRGELR